MIGRLSVRHPRPAMACAALAVFMLAVGPAAMAGPARTAGPSAADSLPLPPLPPNRVPAAAPVPNPDVATGIVPQSAHVSLEPRVFRPDTFNPGLGFAPGSKYQTPEERKPVQTPGLSLTVPIQ